MKNSMLGIFRKVTSGSASIAGLCIKLVLKKLPETGDFEFVPCCCSNTLVRLHSDRWSCWSTFMTVIQCDWIGNLVRGWSQGNISDGMKIYNGLVISDFFLSFHANRHYVFIIMDHSWIMIMDIYNPTEGWAKSKHKLIQ